MTDRVAVLPLAPIEGVHLGGLIGEFLTLLAASDTADPGVSRLTPSAYPGDDDASAEFAATTRDDLITRRRNDALLVQAALARFAAAGPATTDDDDTALAVHDLVIPLSELDAWLRTLSAIRLVMASRLGITDENDSHDPEDPHFAVYEWLGYRLDGLVQLGDEAL